MHPFARALLVPVLLGAAQPAAPQAPITPPNDPRLRALDSAIGAVVADGFSGVVLIADGERILFERAYGAAAALPAAAGDVAFWLASDSKQFTAAAIVRLEAMGRLAVTDSLKRWFPGAPSEKASITLHQLLTHTAGMPTAYATEGIADRDQAIATLLRLGLRRRPGERYEYSNDGYNLLAAVVELAAGVPFDRFLADSLFAPAGLRHAGLWGAERPDVVLAPPADPRRVARLAATIWKDGHSVGNWGYRGSGGAYASARDVHRWVHALQSGRVLGEAPLARLLGHHVLLREDSTGASYVGYGWGVRTAGGRDVSYAHVGNDDALGHNAVIRFTPAGALVVVLSNAGDVRGAGWSEAVNRLVRRHYDGP
ncbi:MAG: beta-lactamase family protein [Gemmatimonadetes bacterium]|nr:beta-lactamase family protein [Gemmatimonadota bacterium]